jgi:hypothetical protein
MRCLNDDEEKKKNDLKLKIDILFGNLITIYCILGN